VARFTAQRYRFPGVDIKARLFRNYPLGEVGSHAIGYIGRINQARKRESGFRGRSQLPWHRVHRQAGHRAERGAAARHHGVEQMETSAGGRAVRKLNSFPATPGKTVVLSLDIKLQKMVEELSERRGALVAIDPRNGEVLALVSKPTFDPTCSSRASTRKTGMPQQSIDKPLLNRALRGTYPPGSTYKPFMAWRRWKRASARRLPSHDGGSWTFGGHTFRSHDHGLGAGHAPRHRQSSNVYYYSWPTTWAWMPSTTS
jgi:penicillin-binding protein 2